MEDEDDLLLGDDLVEGSQGDDRLWRDAGIGTSAGAVIEADCTGARVASEVDHNRTHLRTIQTDGYTRELGTTSKEMDMLLERMKAMDKQTEELNECLGQLMVAVSLKRHMEMCVSRRTDLPLRHQVQVDWLSSGSLLLSVRVTNVFTMALRDWTLAVSLIPLKSDYGATCSNDPILSKQMSLPVLATDESFVSEVLLGECVSVPCVVSSRLIRVFPIHPTVYRPICVRLPDQLLTVWQLVRHKSDVHFVPSSVTNGRSSGLAADRTDSGRLELRLAETLVYLVCGGQEATETGLLQWLLSRVDVSRTATRDLTVCGDGDVSMGVTVVRSANTFRLTLDVNPSSWLKRFQRDLAARFLSILSETWRFPADKGVQSTEELLLQLSLVSLKDGPGVKNCFHLLSQLFPIS